MVLPFVLIVHFDVVLPEERYLEGLHGETYREYKRSVRRWL
jgi:protein-S-isoprenylcysteine O-methyltransferase Ste14